MTGETALQEKTQDQDNTRPKKTVQFYTTRQHNTT